MTGDGDTATPESAPVAARRAFSVERDNILAAMRQVEELRRLGEDNVETALLQLNVTSVASVPGARYAGVTMLDPGGRVTSVAPTHRFAATLDDIQQQTKEGPCLSAAWTQHIIHIADLHSDQRWPHYRSAALSATPVRSILCFRLVGEQAHSVAALNFYADTPGVFDEDSVEIGLIYAAHTMMVWNLMRQEQQFRSALASRDVIGQAKGILMERYELDAVAAFELLKRLSQQTNTKLVELAERLIAVDH